jgi:hypothetical protein
MLLFQSVLFLKESLQMLYFVCSYSPLPFDLLINNLTFSQGADIHTTDIVLLIFF